MIMDTSSWARTLGTSTAVRKNLTLVAPLPLILTPKPNFPEGQFVVATAGVIMLAAVRAGTKIRAASIANALTFIAPLPPVLALEHCVIEGERIVPTAVVIVDSSSGTIPCTSSKGKAFAFITPLPIRLAPGATNLEHRIPSRIGVINTIRIDSNDDAIETR
jgi:hypothetical protein